MEKKVEVLKVRHDYLKYLLKLQPYIIIYQNSSFAFLLDQEWAKFRILVCKNLHAKTTEGKH